MITEDPRSKSALVLLLGMMADTLHASPLFYPDLGVDEDGDPCAPRRIESTSEALTVALVDVLAAQPIAKALEARSESALERIYAGMHSMFATLVGAREHPGAATQYDKMLPTFDTAVRGSKLVHDAAMAFLASHTLAGKYGSAVIDFLDLDGPTKAKLLHRAVEHTLSAEVEYHMGALARRYGKPDAEPGVGTVGAMVTSMPGGRFMVVVPTTGPGVIGREVYDQLRGLMGVRLPGLGINPACIQVSVVPWGMSSFDDADRAAAAESDIDRLLSAEIGRDKIVPGTFVRVRLKQQVQPEALNRLAHHVQKTVAACVTFPVPVFVLDGGDTIEVRPAQEFPTRLDQPIDEGAVG